MPQTARRTLKAAAIFFFHYGDACARGDYVDELFGKHADDFVHPVGGIAGIVLQPLTKNTGETRGHRVGGGAGFEAADDAKPCGDGLANQRCASAGVHFLLERNPDVRGITVERFAEESGWRDADDAEGMALDVKGGADDLGVAGVDGLPGAMAEDDDRGRSGRVVLRGEDATGKRADAESGEIISGDIFGAERAGGLLAFATDAGVPAAGLERGDFFKFGHLRFQALEEGVGIHAPFVLWAAFDAALVAFADAIEAGGVGDGERADHYGVD